MAQKKKEIEELITRGVESVIVREELEKALSGKKPLRIYYGVDPSGPMIHLGHAVILRKLAKFQEMGHKIIFLIGDFTGMIGDPTDREAVRTPLTREQVLENAKTYKKQIAKILKLEGKNPVEIRFNSEWNDKMTLKDFAELAPRFSVQQLMERDMFKKRLKEEKTISLLEFLYPVIQGYDAVMLDADMQVGGSDQLFNMHQGRDLSKSIKGKTQMVMTFGLLEGTDGRKMSKSFNNVIAIDDEPNDMYGKIMSIKDELIVKYMTLCTDFPTSEIDEFEKTMKAGKVNPRDAKAALALEVVKIFHGKKAAKAAQDNFEKTVVNKEIPNEMPVIKVAHEEMEIVDLVMYAGLAPSKSEARRLIDQGAVRVDGAVIGDRDAVVETYSGMTLQVGKRKFAKIK